MIRQSNIVVFHCIASETIWFIRVEKSRLFDSMNSKIVFSIAALSKSCLSSKKKQTKKKKKKHGNGWKINLTSMINQAEFTQCQI